MLVYGLIDGVTTVSVHPSVDDAIASSGWGEPVRQGTDYAVWDGGMFNGSVVSIVNIVPSLIHEGFWCINGAEGITWEQAQADPNASCCEAFDYFPEEDWMFSA